MLDNKLIKLRVKDIRSKNMIKLNLDTKLSYAIEEMITQNIHEVLIVEKEKNEKLLGIITLTDVSKLKREKADLTLELSHYMSTCVITVDCNESIISARKILLGNGIGRLPVYENGKIIGIVRINDINGQYCDLVKFINKQFKPLINSMHEGVVVIDAQGKVIIWNERLEIMYNIKAKEIKYKNIDEFFPNALISSVLKDKKKVKNKYHSPKEGFYAVISASPIYIDGQFWGVVATERDVTDYVKMSKQLENANSKLVHLEEEVNKITNDYISIGDICGKSKKMQNIISISKKVATTKTSVMIYGESGSGKEVLARAIHQDSGRKGMFVPVNCGSIPYTLFESEFFGYVGGAFTGALQNGKMGYFELADKGTILLDEIGNLPFETQEKLLRLLQEKKVYRVGSTKPIKVDIRVIAATNKDLSLMVSEGKFREDLYYRLNVVEIEIPPLRERKEEIIHLFNRFLKETCDQNKIKVKNVQSEAIEILQKYKWKGNIRELKNTAEYMAILSENDEITRKAIPSYIVSETLSTLLPETIESLNLESTIKTLEKELIERAMEKADGNKAIAAKFLGIPRSTLYYKMK